MPLRATAWVPNTTLEHKLYLLIGRAGPECRTALPKLLDVKAASSGVHTLRYPALGVVLVGTAVCSLLVPVARSPATHTFVVFI